MQRGKDGATGLRMIEKQLGQRVREIRLRRGITLAVLGSKTGMTKGYLSLVERGVKVPTIASLVKITKALDVAIGVLFEAEPPQDPVAIVRKGERKPFVPAVRAGSRRDYHYESLTFRAAKKHMEAFVVVPPVKANPDQLYDHDGEELIFILSGRVELILRDRLYVLGPGDCGFFDSSLPHTYRSASPKRASMLIVIYPAQYEQEPRPLSREERPSVSAPRRST